MLFRSGFGTFDELFELLTLAQTGKLDRTPLIVLHGASYWREVVNFDALVRHGMITAEDLKLFHIVDSPDEAMAVLQDKLRPEPEPVTPALARSMTATRGVSRTLTDTPPTPGTEKSP